MASAPQLEAKLREIVAAERDEMVAGLTDGGPQDYAAYREQVGYIRALDQFTEWCAQAEKELDER
jgi:hypothetical protein